LPHYEQHTTKAQPRDSSKRPNEIGHQPFTRVPFTDDQLQTLGLGDYVRPIAEELVVRRGTC